MENYLLCGELCASGSFKEGDIDAGDLDSSGRVRIYKGRRRGTVDFCGIWKQDKSLKELVANGVRIMHTLDHLNVLRFYEWYETPKHIWVITELASGGVLSEILQQDLRIAPDKVGGFVKDISSGLNYLHCSDILYCDLRPQKVILDTCCTLKLSDFSLACSSKNPPDSSSERFLSDSRTWFQTKERPRPKTEPLTMKKGQQQQQRCDDVSPLDCSSSNHLYSPFYAAPELFAGSAFSVATDMWSLGCVVFEMLVGRRPFCADSLEALQEMVRGDLGEELGAWSKLVCSLLEKLPDQRCSWPQFAGVLGEVLPS